MNRDVHGQIVKVGTGKKIPWDGEWHRLGCSVWVLPGRVQFFVLIPTYVVAIFVGVFVSCYVASRRGVARGSGWVPVPTYVFYLRRYLFPNRLRNDCRDGSGNQYPSRSTRFRPGFFGQFQPLSNWDEICHQYHLPVEFGQCLRRNLKNCECSWSNWDETCH